MPQPPYQLFAKIKAQELFRSRRTSLVRTPPDELVARFIGKPRASADADRVLDDPRKVDGGEALEEPRPIYLDPKVGGGDRFFEAERLENGIALWMFAIAELPSRVAEGDDTRALPHHSPADRVEDEQLTDTPLPFGTQAIDVHGVPLKVVSSLVGSRRRVAVQDLIVSVAQRRTIR